MFRLCLSAALWTVPWVLLFGNTAEASSKEAELKSYKAEVRAKTIAVGKAEVTLNEVGHI